RQGGRGDGGRSLRYSDFGDADPAGQQTIAMTHDTQVSTGGRWKVVPLKLQRLPAGLPGEDHGPDDGVRRDFNVEVRAAGVAHVPRDVHMVHRHDGAEVVADPLAVAPRRPAGGEAVVERVGRDVATVVRARDDRDRSWGCDEDVC